MTHPWVMDNNCVKHYRDLLSIMARTWNLGIYALWSWPWRHWVKVMTYQFFYICSLWPNSSTSDPENHSGSSSQQRQHMVSLIKICSTVRLWSLSCLQGHFHINTLWSCTSTSKINRVHSLITVNIICHVWWRCTLRSNFLTRPNCDRQMDRRIWIERPIITTCISPL